MKRIPVAEVPAEPRNTDKALKLVIDVLARQFRRSPEVQMLAEAKALLGPSE